MDPFSAGMFASIGSAFKFADVAVRIAEVGSENAVFVRTICVVRSDLEEVERLLSLESVQKKLTATPGKLPWIKIAIHNTRYALNEIGKWVERARVEQESTGSIKFDTRVRWVFSDHEKLLNRKTELSTCHQQLSIILGYLTGLEVAPAHSASQEHENAKYFDDILARHRRASRPTAPNTHPDKKSNVNDGALHTSVVARSVSSPASPLPPVSGHRSSSIVRGANAYEQNKHESSPSTSSTLSTPCSPPPTYTTAVSNDPFAFDARPSLCSPPMTNGTAITGPVTDRKDTLKSPYNETWAYRSNFDGMAISELAGDTVVFSATDSAGPVNPYELCDSPGKVTLNSGSSSRRQCYSLSEMLGDLRFPVELASNDPGPPPGYPPRSRATFDQAGLSQISHSQLRNRTMSETPSVVHRRPLPTNALSDSLLTVHELPPSTGQLHIPPLISSAIRPSNRRQLISGNSTHQSYTNQRPSSVTAHQSHWSTHAPMPVPNRHYSAPPPAPMSHTDYAAAFSADSTSSWGLDTQPKAPKTPREQEPVVATRMQSQKQIMDLLGRIGS